MAKRLAAAIEMSGFNFEPITARSAIKPTHGIGEMDGTQLRVPRISASSPSTVRGTVHS
jgi:hypothetical protein